MASDAPLTCEKIRSTLIVVLTEIQEANMGEVPDFTDDLCLLEDLDGFDSLNAVEVEAMLQERLGIKIPDGILYKDGKLITFGQAVERLCQLVQAGVGDKSKSKKSEQPHG